MEVRSNFRMKTTSVTSSAPEPMRSTSVAIARTSAVRMCSAGRREAAARTEGHFVVYLRTLLREDTILAPHVAHRRDQDTPFGALGKVNDGSFAKLAPRFGRSGTSLHPCKVR